MVNDRAFDQKLMQWQRCLPPFVFSKQFNTNFIVSWIIYEEIFENFIWVVLLFRINNTLIWTNIAIQLMNSVIGTGFVDWPNVIYHPVVSTSFMIHAHFINTLRNRTSPARPPAHPHKCYRYTRTHPHAYNIRAECIIELRNWIKFILSKWLLQVANFEKF